MNFPPVSRSISMSAALCLGLLSAETTRAQITFSTIPGLGVPDAFYASSDGSVLAGTSRFGTGALNSHTEAFRWTESDGYQYLGTVPGKISTTARGISGDGSIIVGEASTVRPGEPYVQEAFRWSQSTGMQGLGYLPGETRSIATAISTDGSTIVGYGDAPHGGGDAFRWTATGGMQSIGPGLAYGVSANGNFVVGEAYLSFSQQAFLWSEDTGTIGLGNLFQRPGGSHASFVLSDGSLVAGNAYDEYDRSYGFLWTPEAGMRDLMDILVNVYGIGDQVEGWSQLSISGLSDDGRYLFGRGFSPRSGSSQWMLDRGPNPPDFPPGSNPPPLTPVPEPATYGVVGALLLAGLALRRRVRTA